VLTEHDDSPSLSARGRSLLHDVRDRLWWAEDDTTTLVTEAERTRWWTFVGSQANQALEAHLGARGLHVSGVDELSVTLVGTVLATEIREALVELDPAKVTLPEDPRRLEDLKFSAALPIKVGLEVLGRRDLDTEGLSVVKREGVGSARA